MGVRPARRLLDPGAPGGDRTARRVPAASPVVPVGGISAARALKHRPRRRSGVRARATANLDEKAENPARFATRFAPTSRAAHSERSLQMLDADEPAGEIERNADRVEADDGGERPLGP